MKQAFLIFLIIIELTKIAICQNINIQVIDSTTNQFLENVYLYDSNNNLISISNSNGECTILYEPLILNISHIGYLPKSIPINNPYANEIKIQLTPKVFEISEITVTATNAKKIIQKTISRIDSNYNSLTKDTIPYYTEFSFYDGRNNKIADFEGNIAITKQEGIFYGSKYYLKNELIDNVFFDYNNEISPSGFYNIIPVRSHSPIRLNKKYEFVYDGNTIFRDMDVYKISFSREGKYSKVKGYMLINKIDYAIVYLIYEIGKIDKWIAATHKGKGIIFTNLISNKIEVEYEQLSNGYTLSKGNINMKFNRTNKKQILSENTYEVSLEMTTNKDGLEDSKFLIINDLFQIHR